MPTKPLPPNGPTRRAIEQLFRELMPRWGNDEVVKGYAAVEKAEAEAEAFEEKILANKKLVALQTKASKLRREFNAEKDKVKEVVKKLHNYYLANGITPYLVRELNRLIAVKK